MVASILFKLLISSSGVPDQLKTDIFIFVGIRIVLCILICIFVALFFRQNPINEDVNLALGDENNKFEVEKGILDQMKVLASDKIYLLFVFGPLLSICSLESIDTHIPRILAVFEFTSV